MWKKICPSFGGACTPVATQDPPLSIYAGLQLLQLTWRWNCSNWTDSVLTFSDQDLPVAKWLERDSTWLVRVKGSSPSRFASLRGPWLESSHESQKCDSSRDSSRVTSQHLWEIGIKEDVTPLIFCQRIHARAQISRDAADTSRIHGAAVVWCTSRLISSALYVQRSLIWHN